MSELDFFINRFMRMSIPELFYRVGQKIQGSIEKSGMYSFKADTSPTGYIPTLFSKKLEYANEEEILKKADSILSHRLDIFALKDFYIGKDIDYHKDYKHGITAPDNVFGKFIDYRDSSKIGDIKYIWEINRHLFLLPLALAFNITGEVKYIEKFSYFMKEWFDQNEFMKGVNWTSSLELGIRLINWTLCWHMLGNTMSLEFKKRWLESVYEHCWFINRNLSAFSSANNHLIGEAAGLFIASTAMPEFKESRKWRKKSFEILVNECSKQNYEDGVNKEQAVSYQQFVLDFLVLSALVGEANDIKFPQNYWFIVEKMLVYLASIEDYAGNIPHYGDEDDGYVTDMMQREYGAYRSLLNTGAYLFKREEFLKGTRGIDSKSLLLLNIGKINIENMKLEKKELPVQFEEGGYYLLGSDFNMAFEEKLIFDCGSLGYLSLAAHGHADALSFYFSAGGYPIFIDPGTYAYHADKKWRNYFRGTSAHNTIRVDGKDQSTMAGNFMWSRKAKAEIIEYERLNRVKGSHNGYMALEDSVLHAREINHFRIQDTWEIKDSIICKASHAIEVFYHIHPDCRVLETEKGFDIYFAVGRCEMEIEPDFEKQLFKGEEDIPLGWYSPSYDIRIPTHTIRLIKNIHGSTEINTRFRVIFGDSPPLLKSREGDGR